MTAKSRRKLARRLNNERLASEAPYWSRKRTAEALGYTRPVNRQARNELSHRKKK